MRRKAMSAKYSGDSGHSFGLVAVVLNQETLILLKNRMRESFEAKVWTSTHLRWVPEILICCTEALDRC